MPLGLLLNPNLTEAQVCRLTQQHAEAQTRLLATARGCAADLPPELRVRYFLAVLPLLL